MAIFNLKYRDTRPTLEVALKNPDNTAHDLTGSTSWKLHIRLSDGSVLTRTMVKEGADTDGVLRYSWITTDWDAVSGGGAVGGLVVGVGHRMEYEVIGAAGSRLTFPNTGYDVLKVVVDIGQGA